MKVCVMAEIPDSTGSAQLSSDGIFVGENVQTEVQVKSSNAEPQLDETTGDADVASDTTDDDDDLDQPVPDQVKNTSLINKSTPTMPDNTIMETPHTSKVAQGGDGVLPNEDEPYSTAQEGPNRGSVDGDGAMSPAAQALSKRRAKAASLKDSPLAPQEPADVIETGPESSPVDSDNEIESTPKIKKTYGKHHSRRTASRRTPRFRVMDADSDELEGNPDQEGAAVEEQSSRGSPDYFATSELDLNRVARLTAGAEKRSAASLAENDDDEDIPVSNKRRRTSTPRVVAEQYNDEETNAIEDVKPIGLQDNEQAEIEEDEEEIKPARKSKPRSTAKLTRRKTKSTSPEEPTKRNSSPVVVITTQRTGKNRTPASKSPPSSASSSILNGKAPNVLLSNDSTLRKGATATFLKKQGATIIDDVKTRRAKFVCVLKGGRLTTAKVLRSLALGKLVVTEDWITESKKADHLLEPNDFIHEDLKPTVDVDRSTIFNGINLFFTKTLAKAYGSGWKDIQELAKEAGASHVQEGDSGTLGKLTDGRVEVICFGKEYGDADVPRMKKQQKVKVYHKNLLTQSIIKGKLDLDGEEYVLSG